MEKIAPSSSPMMTVPSAAETAIFGAVTDAPDSETDIPDPPVPAGTLEPTMATPSDATWRAHEALLSGFCQALSGQMSRLCTDEAIRLTKNVDATITRLMDYVHGRLEGNEHAQYQLSDALATLHEHGANFVHAKAHPYTAVIDARTPHGFPLRLALEKGTSGELIEELGRLEGWLVHNGYTVVEGQVA